MTAAKIVSTSKMRRNLPAPSLPGVIGEESMGVLCVLKLAGELETISSELPGPNEDVGRAPCCVSPKSWDRDLNSAAWPSSLVFIVNPELLWTKTLMSPDAS